VPAEHLDAAETIQACKDLSRVERSFPLKSVDLDPRPIRHWTADRVRTHLLLCRLAYHVEWHLRETFGTAVLPRYRSGCGQSEANFSSRSDRTVGCRQQEGNKALGRRSANDALRGASRNIVPNIMRVPARAPSTARGEIITP
jgi:hypothetical protein